MNPWFGIAAVLVSLIALLYGCRHLASKYALSAELSRKIVHMGMGLICTLFPLFFLESWPVVLLAAIAITSLVLVRVLPRLRQTIGSSLHGVERSSMGEIYFPLAVGIVWYLSVKTPLFYSLSILVLTLADAFAALVGTQYGRQHYTTKEGYKTWEGSFIFFTVTFLCIHIPLLLLTDTGRLESLLLALLIGILVSIIEAVSWRGLDNLFIPICVCVFLNVYAGFDSPQILLCIGIIVIATLLLFFVRSRVKLDDASLLGASLVTYIVITAGGWQWGLAPLLVFVNYLFLGPKRTTEAERVHNINALIAVTAPGFIWLMLFFRYHNPLFLVCFNIAYMAELICIYIAQWAFQYPHKTLFRITCKSAAYGFSMVMLPFFFVNWHFFSIKLFVVAGIIALLSSQFFRFFQPQIRDCPLTPDRFLRQGLIGLTASVFVWAFLVLPGKYGWAISLL